MSPMNELPFRHVSHNGTEFNCNRCDFKTPVYYIPFPGVSLPRLLTDLAEMVGWHALNICPNLNGFTGYDCVEFLKGDAEPMPPPALPEVLPSDLEIWRTQGKLDAVKAIKNRTGASLMDSKTALEKAGSP
jgi:hypothetical protein